jgi:hypothetical protein
MVAEVERRYPVCQYIMVVDKLRFFKAMKELGLLRTRTALPRPVHESAGQAPHHHPSAANVLVDWIEERFGLVSVNTDFHEPESTLKCGQQIT